ncbi:ChaN family lipoprotein [Variovorax sp. J22P168]|uniref:ChaN family lipoprotein n=1 Tax=Variovorax jilinensis TaxID=3053513 RepID=UPI002574B2FA|nr:ChaN family lipoprotein [Variovorax sp. J22P168]MDM0010937.1 ChaN family lipoprotein [Variovorax sp. J22P168]
MTAVLAALLLGSTIALSACSSPGALDAQATTSRRVASQLPTDALLLGEQHDAVEHQVIEREAVEALAQRGRLAALALEMAEEGNTTAHLHADATEVQVRTALSWNDKAWPWAAYGPVVMAAVRAGAPVIGANLQRAHMKDAMADVSLDAQLAEPARLAQQDAVRDGHCRLLPESQIVPMTRIQIARDRAMAQTVVKARVPGKTVLLVIGAGHGNKLLGVPQHLPTDVAIKAVRLQAGPGDNAAGAFDAVWLTPALPEKDYCADVKAPPPRSAG